MIFPPFRLPKRNGKQAEMPKAEGVISLSSDEGPMPQPGSPLVNMFCKKQTNIWSVYSVLSIS